MKIDAVRDHGMVVWGHLKRTSPVWAGVVISTKTLDLVYEEKVEKTWIFWLAEKSLSNVENKFIYNLGSDYEKHTKNLTGNRKKGVMEAIEIVAHQFNIPIPIDVLRTENVVLWAGENLFKNTKNQIGKLTRQEAYFIPVDIIREIRIMNSRNINQELPTGMKPGTKRKSLEQNTNIIKPFSVHKSCIGCRNEIIGKKTEHPLFFGYLCQTCHTRMKQYIMTISKDKFNDVCCICCVKSNYEVVLCENCIRIYCKKCLSYFCGKSSYNNIVKTKIWNCYACCPSSNIPCLLRRKSTNEQLRNIFTLYTPPVEYIEPILHSIPEINILALKDGQNLVSSILNVLDYPYKLEENLFEKNNDYKPQQCHLLIQYYSNNDEEIFDTTGTMKEFFDFVFIKNKIKAINNANATPFFWAFECCSAISFADRDTISRFCGSEPALISVGVKNVYQRGRFIWTNICLQKKDLRLSQNHNILVQNIDESALVEEDTPISYESVFLLLSTLIRCHIE